MRRGRQKKTAIDRLPEPGGFVTDIRASAQTEGHFSIRVGRKSTGLVRADDLKKLAVRIGDDWNDELRVRVAHVLDLAKARQYAIRAAVSRPMSARQLQLKLARRGVARSDAQTITDHLIAKGVLDDAAFALGSAASELARKPAGRSLLTAKLRTKGVDGKTADKAVAQVMADVEYNPRDSAFKLAERRAASLSRLDPVTAQRRLYGLLARRGFDPDTCAWVVRKVLGKAALAADDD